MAKRIIIGILVFLFLTNVLPVYADRGMIPISVQNANVRENSQKAIILHNMDEEVLILGTDLVANKNTKILEFIPFPSEPKVSLAKREPFEAAIKLIKKYKLQFIYEDNNMRSRGGGSSILKSSPVEMRFHAQVGLHDVSVVKINQIKEFGKWVRKFLKNKVVYQGKNYKKVESVANDYVKRGIKYFVFDMVYVKTKTNSVKPLVYRFKSKKLYYPLKTSNTFGGEGGIDLILIAPYIYSSYPNDILKEESSYNYYFDNNEVYRPHPFGVFKLASPEPPSLNDLKTPFAFRISTSAGIAIKDVKSIYTPAKKFFFEKGPIFIQLMNYTGVYDFKNDLHIDIPVSVLNTKLIYAVRSGNTKFAKILISKGANVNANDQYGYTVLVHAIQFGNTEAVKLLLSKGADINAKCISFETALIFALKNRNAEIIKCLLSKGSDINAKGGRYGGAALIYALKKKDIKAVKLLLSKGANVNAKDNDGFTALMWAVEGGNAETVKLLLSKGANVNAKDTFGFTALIDAAKSGYTEIVKVLLTNGANVNAKDTFGFTALMWAVRARCTEIAKLLLSKGADINAKDNDGRTALMWAVENRYIEIVKVLLSNDADVNIKDKIGGTALFEAMMFGYTKIIHLLKQAGAKEE